MSDFKKLKIERRLELSYLHGGEAISLPREVLGPRELRDFELVYIIEGGVTYLSDGIRYAVPPGGFILGRPGIFETYFWNPQSPTRHAFFHFGIEAVPADWPQPEEWVCVRTALSPVCVSLFRHILQRIYLHRDWPAVRPEATDCRPVETLLDTFIGGCGMDDISFERERPEPVRLALAFLRNVVEENPGRPVTLADAARAAHVTEKHLCRLFAVHFDRSPMQTFTLLKLQSAQSLLARTNLLVKEIAERCGFDNPLYFSRCFSKTYGCSPTVYRERLRGGKPLFVINPLPADVMPRIRW